MTLGRARLREDNCRVVSKALLQAIRNEFALEWDGPHGISHWQRVRDIGLLLAQSTGAIVQVVELFAFLHDSKRVNNKRDPGHGRRAVDFIRTLRGELICMPDEQFELLILACERHTDGLTQADVTVQTCWDADRLDLGRCGIRPEAGRLCTVPAKEPALIEWAFLRSQGVDLGPFEQGFLA